MKTVFSILLMLAIFTAVKAQTPRKTVNITSNSVVKQENGTILASAVWQKMMQSGKYQLKMENSRDENTAFFIIPVSTDELNARMESIPKPRESSFFKTGKSMAPFKATDINGNEFNLAALKGKVVVLNFWFVGCAPCRKEIPDLNEMKQGFVANKDVVFIALALDDKPAVLNFLQTNPFQYNIVDNGSSVANMYGISSYPTHVVVDKSGIVRFHTTGLASNTVYWVKKTITELAKS